VKETEGDEGIVLVVKIKEEERGVRKIERWNRERRVSSQRGFIRVILQISMDKVAIFSIEIFSRMIMITLFSL